MIRCEKALLIEIDYSPYIRFHMNSRLLKFACTGKFGYLEVNGTIFYKFKLPEVQINLHFG